MEKVTYLKPGEEVKYYSTGDDIVKELYRKYTKISVDENYFKHSFNDEPTHIGYHESGVISYRIWRKHGVVHRLTGPHSIYYDKTGKILEKIYAINGKRLTQEQWEIEANRLTLLSELTS